MKLMAYGVFMMSFLLRKIVYSIYTFNSTNLHQNAVKNYLNHLKYNVFSLVRNCKKSIKVK